jgi:hypothetical protein
MSNADSPENGPIPGRPQRSPQADFSADKQSAANPDLQWPLSPRLHPRQSFGRRYIPGDFYQPGQAQEGEQTPHSFLLRKEQAGWIVERSIHATFAERKATEGFPQQKLIPPIFDPKKLRLLTSLPHRDRLNSQLENGVFFPTRSTLHA